MEDILQLRLFDRHSRGVRPTEAGTAFFRSARRVLADLRRLDEELDLLSSPGSGTGVSWMLGMGRFGNILGSFIGGALLGLGWGFGAILAMLAIPAACAAAAIALTQLGSAGAATREAAAR